MVSTARLVADNRLLVSTVVVLGVLSALGLVLVVGPMRARVDSLTQRATAASLAAATAANELTQAREVAAGRTKAEGDLQRFYAEILPATQPAARQVTFVRLAQLARESNLTYDHRTFVQDPPGKEGVLTRATLSMSVFGSYRDLRAFLYTLETGPEFVVIREVRVAQADDAREPLEAALTLATYYKGDDGQ